MAAELRFPIVRKRKVHQWVLQVDLPIQVRSSHDDWKWLVFLFDSGTQLTTIPIAMAEQLSIPFATDRPVSVDGAVGTGKGYLSPVLYSFPGLPELQFEALCCFSEYQLRQPLMSLTDLLSQFTLRTLRPSHKHPLGSFVLRLHSGQQGQRRE